MDKENPKLALNGGKPVSEKMIPIHIPYLDEADFESVDKATRSTYISGDGGACREFEKKICEYLGVKHAFYMNSCTAALELAFRVKNLPEGGEVLVPDFTYTSTALGAIYNNLKVTLVDVLDYNGNIDTAKLEAAITDKTVALAPVDYAGIPADMDEVNRIAGKHKLFVVHDTAQSFGSELNGIKTGNFADVSTFSFHATKNLTTGEGGALVTNDDNIAERVKVMRDKGTDKYTFISNNRSIGYYEYIDVGHSYVQSNILGALGASQIDKFDRVNALRDKIAGFYLENMGDIPDLQLPQIPAHKKTNWHVFYILVPEGTKEWVMSALLAEGIHVNVHYSPLHMNRYYKEYGTDADFPGAVHFYNRLLRLPIYPSLKMSEAELVVAAVRKVFGKD
jgi:dTDP-4-amino-4,6-dideoxygalactose transaminase